MEVISKQVREEKSSVTVEFVGEGGDVVSVQLKKNEDGNLTPLNAEEKAKAIMVQIATFDTDGAHVAQTSEASRDDEETALEQTQASSRSEQGALDGKERQAGVAGGDFAPERACGPGYGHS